jgi:hypothetical protein
MFGFMRVLGFELDFERDKGDEGDRGDKCEGDRGDEREGEELYVNFLIAEKNPVARGGLFIVSGIVAI